MTADHPEEPKRGYESKQRVVVAGLLCPAKRGSVVVVVTLELGEELGLARPGAGDDLSRPLGGLEEVKGVAAAKPRPVVFRQAVVGIVADRREHPETRLASGLLLPPEQAVVEERSERVEVGAADLAERLQRTGACENRQPLEQRLLRSGQQVVAPLDRRPQRLMANGQVAVSCGQELERTGDPRQDLRRREEVAPGRRELDRERDSVEQAADLGDGRRVRFGQLESRVDRSGTGHEHRHGVVLLELVEPEAGAGRLERRHGVDIFARKPQRSPARRHGAEPGRPGQQLRDRGRRLENVLEVVENEQEVARSESCEQRSAGFVVFVRDTDGRSERRPDEGRFGKARELHEDGALRGSRSEGFGDGDRESCLADAAGADEGDEPGSARFEQVHDRSDLLLSADEGRGGTRQDETRGCLVRRLDRERGIVAEDRPLELAQLGARLDPELVAELRMGAAIRLERVGLALRAVESEHQLPPDLFAVGVPDDQRRELRDECNVVTEGKAGLVSELFGDEPQLREPLPLGADETDEREAGERFPLPELECRVGRGLCAGIVGGCKGGPPFGQPPRSKTTASISSGSARRR